MLFFKTEYSFDADYFKIFSSEIMWHIYKKNVKLLSKIFFISYCFNYSFSYISFMD